LTWLERELTLAKPSFVITLGAEVAGIVQGVASSSAQIKLLRPVVRELEVGKEVVPAMHCAHPGILMRKSSRNFWPEVHRKEFIPALRKAKRTYGF
jgi:uracil-DNA glycosylase